MKALCVVVGFDVLMDCESCGSDSWYLAMIEPLVEAAVRGPEDVLQDKLDGLLHLDGQ